MQKFNFIYKILIAGVSLFLSIHTNAQLTIKIDSVTASSGLPVKLAVRAWNFKSILSIQGTIAFDHNIISYDSINQFGLPGLAISNFGISQISSGKFIFAWYDGTLSGVTIPDSTVIFTLNFNVVGANGQQSSVQFVNTPTQLQFVDTSYNAVQSDFVQGFVNVVNAPLSTLKISGENDFSIYPNPAIDQLTIHTSSTANWQTATLSVMDVLGQIIQEEKLNWSGDVSININNLAAGMYFLGVKSENGNVVKRFVKE